MSNHYSMLSVMNAALLAQGQEEILASGDGSVEWRLLFRNWPFIVEAELEKGRYQFTRQESFLESRIPGQFQFEDGYLKALDALHVRRVWTVDDQGHPCDIDWIQNGTHIFCNASAGIWVESLISAEPHLWSATFINGIKHRLEALISRAIKEESADGQRMDDRADTCFEDAMTLSSKGRSATTPFKPGGISKIRRGGA